MPPHKASGPSKRKTRACPFKDCDARPRGGKGYNYHLKTVHGIEDSKEFFRVEGDRHMMGLPSVYDRHSA